MCATAAKREPQSQIAGARFVSGSRPPPGARRPAPSDLRGQGGHSVEPGGLARRRFSKMLMQNLRHSEPKLTLVCDMLPWAEDAGRENKACQMNFFERCFVPSRLWLCGRDRYRDLDVDALS
jgi:hypothetical protein